MNFHKYYPVDVINGEGTRCTLFVSGCIHQCRGCYNQTTWKIDSGIPYTEADEQRIIDDLNDLDIKRQGLSLSGGDPLHPANIPPVLKLVKRVKSECPGKDIWLWTGYEKSSLTLEQQEIVSYIDVLIDGKFELDHKDPSLKWRGSSNQIIYRFK